MNLFVIGGAIFYLIGISQFKEEAFFIDECINAGMFAVLSLIIGQFIRASQLENFAIKAQLHQYAYLDQLTGLANRRKLFEDFQHLENSKDKEHISRLAMMDIDYFKTYNDTYGHQAGDICLGKVAKCFLYYQNQYNIHFYRCGGEEFVVIFYDYSQEEMIKILNEIRENVKAQHIIHSGSQEGVITISIGLATLSQWDKKKYEGLLLQADQALYIAKARGRNGVVRYI